MVNYGTINGSVTATGANNALSFNCTGYGTCGIDVRGTFTATLVPEGTIDNATWFTLTITPVAGGAGVTSITAAGAWTVPTAGFSAIRLRSSAYTSGTPTIVLSGTLASTLNTNVSVTADTEFSAAAALADAASATPTTTTAGVIPLLMNATTVDRQRAVVAALDSAGTGIAAAGICGQFDDTTTAAVTENQFAPVRISTRRALLIEGVASGTAVNVLDTNSAAALTALQLIDDGVYTDDTSTHATGTSKGYGIMAAATPTDGSIDANDIGMVAMTTDRRLHTNTQVSSGGIASGAIASGAIASGALAAGSIAAGAIVSGAILSGALASGALSSGSVASGAYASGSIASGAIASGAIAAGAIATGATSIAAAEDDASANLDTGVKIFAVQKATPANTAGTDGDYEFLQMSAGRLWTNANLGHIGGTATVAGGLAGTLAVGGATATNVAITDNPLNVGAQAVSSENTAVTTARKVQLVADLVGKLIVLPYANPENFVSGAITTAMTGTTSTSLVASPGTGLRNYITQVTVSNSHATVGTDLILQDGSGGTTLYTIPAAAAYGGAAITFPTPLRQPTTSTALFCANVTTGSSIKVSASGYKGI